MTSNVSNKTKQLVQVSIFSAIIVIMAATPFLGYIPINGINVTIIHIPVIIGSIILGLKSGVTLGFVFALTSLAQGTFAPTLLSFLFSPFAPFGNALSLVICFVPRLLIGVVSHYSYVYLKKIFKNIKPTATFAISAVLGSVTNTVLVMSLSYLFFFKEFELVLAEINVYDVFPFILTIIFTNGVLEAIVSAILVSIICKILVKIVKWEHFDLTY